MKIERDIINKFKDWKEAEKHKPILLKGARQIGKTWAMEEFGPPERVAVSFHCVKRACTHN